MSVREIVDKATKDKPRNRVEDLLEREKQEKEAELERLKIERMVEEERKRLEEIRAGRKPKETEEKELGLEDLGLSMKTIKELARLPDEERDRVIQTWAMIKSADKVQSGILLPLLIGFAKANPGASTDNLAVFAKTMADQIKTGIDLARQNQHQQINPVELAKTIAELSRGQGPQYNPVDLIKTFADLVKENVQRPLEELVQNFQPQPSAFERLIMDDRYFERLKRLGLFGGGQTQAGPPDLQLEIEKLKTERDMRLKELDMKLEEMRQQHSQWLMQQQMQAQTEERRWKVVEGLMQGPVGRFVQTMGNAAAAKITGGSPPKPIPIECPQCGHHFYGSSDAKIVVCPKCNTPLTPAPEVPRSEQPKTEVQQSKPEAESTSS